MTSRKGLSVFLDVNFYDHPKVVAAGERADRLYTEALCLAKRTWSDGFVSEAQVAKMGLTGWQKRAATLVEVGLFQRDDERGGWWIHDFLDRNRSRAEQDAIAAKRSEAGKRGGRPKQDPSVTDEQARSKRGASAEQARSKRGASAEQAPRHGSTTDVHRNQVAYDQGGLTSHSTPENHHHGKQVAYQPESKPEATEKPCSDLFCSDLICSDPPPQRAVPADPSPVDVAAAAVELADELMLRIGYGGQTAGPDIVSYVERLLADDWPRQELLDLGTEIGAMDPSEVEKTTLHVLRGALSARVNGRYPRPPAPATAESKIDPTYVPYDPTATDLHGVGDHEPSAS